MKKILSLLSLIVIIGIVIFAGSPYYTAYKLKEAYQNHDGDSLVSYIDINQLQTNIEAQLSQSFAQTLSQYPMVEKLGGEPLTVAADEFISKSVNGAITTDNINRLITTQGQVNVATKELAAVWAIASNKVNLQLLVQDMITQRGDINAVINNQMQLMMDKQAEELATNMQTGEDSQQPDLTYCGIDCFSITGNIKGYPVTIILNRQNYIDWKVVNVILP